ncbi:MAG: MalY/PatB family protein [Pseudomonadota bacterium]
MFDFDEVIDRRGTHCSKWDGMAGRFPGVTDDTIPMWVADMDFRAAPSVNQAVRDLAEHGVHGYFGDDSGLRAAVADWMDTRHGWRPETSWMSWAHGLVAGIGFSVQAFTEPGDAVVVFSPVYHMFGNVVKAAGRTLFESELKNVQGRYQMDLEALGRDLPPSARMVLLCSPHNPGGRVWTEAELKALATFCAVRDLILVSDEIHCDLVYEGSTHLPTQKVAPEIADRLVTLVAPTKTFNIAASLTGCVVIPKAEMRGKFNAAKAACGSGAANRFGMIVAEAAYRGGRDWLDTLVPYLQANRDHLAQTIAAEIPGARPMHLESTYLSWVDFSDTGASPDEVTRKVFEDARIAVNKGPTFGKGGEAFLRFNFACPRATVDQALERLIAAFRA